MGLWLAAAQPATATELDLGRLDTAAANEALVAVIFDGPVSAPASSPTALKRIPAAPAQAPPEAAEPGDRAPARTSGRKRNGQRLTLRFTDLEPGRYGIALYPNDELGRLDLTGLGVPKVEARAIEGRRRPRLDHAIVRLEDNSLSVKLQLSY